MFQIIITFMLSNVQNDLKKQSYKGFVSCKNTYMHKADSIYLSAVIAPYTDRQRYKLDVIVYITAV